MRRAGELRQRQRVHVIERRRDEIAVTRRGPGREPRLDHPDVALVREHDALGRAGRAGGVEKHRRLVGRAARWRRTARIEEAIEAFARRRRRSTTAGKPGGHSRAPRGIAEHELRAGIAQDEIDGLARELEVDRHRDQAGAHDAEVGGEIFRAVGGKDGDAVAARQSARRQRAGDAVGHRVDLRVGESRGSSSPPRSMMAILLEVAVAADQIAEIGEMRIGPITLCGGGGAVK